jgi:hypothetical protein
MSRDPAVAELVSALVGTWLGKGDGKYPTIDSFRYRELLDITERDDHPALHYEQRTWRITDDGEVVSHWETGLLRISSDGSVRLFNAQAGRTESMIGTWRRDDEGWILELESNAFGGDERVRASTRVMSVADGRLTYQMAMETTATMQMSTHLHAELVRQN